MSFKTGDRVIYHDGEGWHISSVTHVVGSYVGINDRPGALRASACRLFVPAVWARIQELEAMLEPLRAEVADLEHQQRDAFLSLDVVPEQGQKRT